MRARIVLTLLVAALAALAPGATGEAVAAPPVITPICSPAPANCSGWYTANVTVTWDVNGLSVPQCPSRAITADTTGEPVSCTATSSDNITLTVTVTVKLDKTPPTVTSAAPSREADANGWYNRALTVTFGATDATSGLAGCAGGGYAGPDSGGAVVTGTCRDVAGNTSAGTFPLRYDATAPEVRAAPARPPDANGWYNHALSVPFAGSDATSGVDSCSTAGYAGPDAAEAVLSGSCRDRAGNSAGASFALRFDATPPALERVAGSPGNRVARLSWKASADTARVEILRTPGREGTAPSVVFRGRASGYVDTKLRNGRRYRYQLAAFDEAGNAARSALTVLPVSPLVRPADGARVRVPPLLAWRPVAGAKLYNVQLHRAGKKVLTLWPKRARLRLPGTWSFAGRAHSLAPGRYTWYVWPWAGGRYGVLIGSRSFVVVR